MGEAEFNNCSRDKDLGDLEDFKLRISIRGTKLSKMPIKRWDALIKVSYLKQRK